MKVPFTQAAQKLVVRRLMKMHSEGWDANASLEKSAIYGYRGVFEVAKRPVEATEKPKAVQVSDEHKARCTPMPAELRKMIGKV